MVVESIPTRKISKDYNERYVRKCPHCSHGMQRLKTIIHHGNLTGKPTFGKNTDQVEFKWHCFTCKLFES